MSIQDDFFELNEYLESQNKEMHSAFVRIWEWGVYNENENEKLRPIVSGMRNAISAMFEQDRG